MCLKTQSGPGRRANAGDPGPDRIGVRLVRTLQDTVVDMAPISDPPPRIPKGIVHWHGAATGSWWAMVPSRLGLRLVEAPSEEHLAVTVDWHLRQVAR